MSYQAIICRIRTFPHPNADKLQLGNAHGYQVVVGLNTIDGQLGVYFPTDGQLSPELAAANDLIRRKDDDGKPAGGMFDANRRVRAQQFRGEKSEGFWIPLDSLSFTGYNIDKLEEGMQFSELNGIPICNKYYTPATIKAMGGNQKKIRKNNKCFAKHADTKQFFHEVDQIPVGSLIYLSEKLHGTSARTANVLEDILPEKIMFKPPKKRLLKWALSGRVGKYCSKWNDWAAKHFSKAVYKMLIGTKNTILNIEKGGYYGNETFRVNAATPFDGHLHKGEIVFYEIVGFTTTGAPIMQTQNVAALKDKQLQSLYGDTMLYRYGCLEGQCDVYVYRIAVVNEDGVLVDLPWAQVKERCKVLGVKHVPEFCFKMDLGGYTHLRDPFWTGVPVEWGDVPNPYIYTGNKDELIKIVTLFMEGPSTLDKSHMREGVVLRVENQHGVSFLKAKNHTFGMLEGYLKDRADYVDLEEIS